MPTRMSQYLTHALSRRFLLGGVGSASIVAAAWLDGWLSVVLAIMGFVAFIAGLYAMSLRISTLTREVKSIERTGVSSIAAPAVSRDVKSGSSDRLVKTIHALRSAERRRQGADKAKGPKLPLVTVVVPCLNEERFIAETLESVRRQSWTDFECIVVDDASTDRSMLEATLMATNDERFKVLRHKINSGLGAARNTGLRAAQGQFITFLDSDDLLTRESLIDRVTTLYDALSDPHVIGSYCGVRVVLEEESLDQLPDRIGDNTGSLVDFISADSECPFNAHAPLLITEFVRGLGGFNESMRHGAEDWDLWYRAMRNGYVFVPSKSTTATYRQKRHSMVRTLSDGHMREAERLIGASYEAVDPLVLTRPAPNPYTEPLHYYREAISVTKRAIRFAAMAMMTGDTGAAERTLQSHRGLPIEILQRHIDFVDEVKKGMQRALAIQPEELDLLTNNVETTAGALFEILTNKAVHQVSQTLLPQPKGISAAFIVHHAGQLRSMVDAAQRRGLQPSERVVIDVSREAGDQGAGGDLPEGMETMSLNEWLLTDSSVTTAFVGTVRVAAADVLARAMAARGTEIVEVPQRYADAMSLLEAHRPLADWSSNDSFSLFGLPSNTGASLEDPAASWFVEEYPLTRADSMRMEQFRNTHRGERAVIIGNGPSLNETDLTRLKSEYTIAVNGIFYATERMGFDPTYYVVEDTAVIKDNLDAIKAYKAGHKFFPSIYRDLIGESPDITYFMMNRGFYEPRSPDYCIPRFSFNPGQRLFSGQSVTIINLQLAYFMGFEEVVLTGMDFSYTIPDNAVIEGDIITSTGDDPNHFHPDYFGSGKVWKDPKLDRVLANYALAKEIYETTGRRIVNATVGGKLDIFERVKYDDYFA